MTGCLRLALAIHIHQPIGNFDGVFEDAYRDSYAPFLEVLRQHPQIPISLHISGSDYKGVRTFAVQVKHIGASNYFIWSPLTGDKLPEGLKDGNGPENLKTKADILQFLKESFALGHKAAATLTTENMLQPPGSGKSSRLHLAEFGVAHAFNHYGQMVEYLRMNGVVPPASWGKSD